MKYVVMLVAGFTVTPAFAAVNDSNITTTPPSYDDSMAGKTSTGTSTNVTTGTPNSAVSPSASDQSGVNMGTTPSGTTSSGANPSDAASPSHP